MYNLTNYSLLFISEIKYRFYYVLLSILCVILLCVYNFNFLLVQLLYSLDKFYLDISFNFLSFFLFSFLFQKFTDVINLTFFDSICSYSISNDFSYDHYPLFEINLSNNNFLYFYILFYFLFLFTFPIFLYHIYLFIIPSLYLNEYLVLKNVFFLFLFFLCFYFYFIHSHLISFFLNFTYNQFQELYNYEFDIEFDFLDFIFLSTYLLFFSLCFICYFLFLFYYVECIHTLFYLKYILFLFFFFLAQIFFIFLFLFFFVIF